MYVCMVVYYEHIKTVLTAVVQLVLTYITHTHASSSLRYAHAYMQLRYVCIPKSLLLEMTYIGNVYS
jgi:hypothetical protein